MSRLEAISILMGYGPEEKVIDYIASKIRTNENYFRKLDKEKLITEFMALN